MQVRRSTEHPFGAVPDVDGLPCDRIVGADGAPVVERFHVIRTRGWSLRIHRWIGSDHRAALHDHPWANVTTVLAGSLIEHTPSGAHPLHAGAVVHREATDLHAIELVDAEAWTVFATGPLLRDWGFHDPTRGWRPWQAYPEAGTVEPVTATAPARQW